MEFSSAEEVLRFESLFSEHQRSKGDIDVAWVSLASAYEKLRGGKIFYALFDLKLNVAALLDELGLMASIRRECEKQKRMSNAWLDNPQYVFALLSIVKSNTTYVLRYRAVLDKMMGLLVMLTEPAKYESFASARSRRAKFAQIGNSSSKLPPTLVSHVLATVDAFNKYRTPEAHGTGSTRKWSLLDDSEGEGPQSDMFWSWNSLLPLLQRVGQLFE